MALVITDIWKTAPYMALLILAGLQMVPDDLYEAAKIDGANVIQRFIYVTLPNVKTTVLVAMLFRTLDAFRYLTDLRYDRRRERNGECVCVRIQ